MGSETKIERAFLGWDAMPLQAATAWLAEHIGPDMSKVVLALPGARSGRLLEDALACMHGKQLRPPRIVTAGSLSDALLELEGQSAGRLARTLAWSRALRGLAESDEAAMKRIVAQAPHSHDFGGWWRLAEEVRTLFGEVAAEDLDFQSVADDATLEDDGVTREGERQRWKALAKAQAAMQQELANCGQTDPHLGRKQALDESRLSDVERVVMIGVVEANGLLRRALRLTEAKCSALIFAPQTLDATFDEFGCLDASKWSLRDGALPLDNWLVADRPVDQAARTRETLASWNDRFSPSQITIGLGNQEVGPFVHRRLDEEHIYARDAAGKALSQSNPALLLSQLGRFLESKSFLALADLVRHMDFELALLKRLASGTDIDPVAVLDKYFNTHYPEQLDGTWLADSNCKRDLALRDSIRRVWEVCVQLLEGLWDCPSQELAATVAPLRAFVTAIYGDREFDLSRSAGRESYAALEAIGKALAEIEKLPKEMTASVSMAEALNLLGRSIQAEYLPPAPADGDKPTIEMLGWLELPLDNAPALVVVGFEDGHVPESVRGDAFLPNQLRRSLGLVDDEQRMARDLYATELLVHSRAEVRFISGRRSVDGDPSRPSRIVFHCPPDEVVARVRRFLEGTSTPSPPIPSEVAKFKLPGTADGFVLEKISVTDFRTYLNSPYEFYLRRVVRAESLDDRSRELNALSFGVLAHDVLERFGREPKVHNKVEAEPVAAFLGRTLHDLARERFGARPLPAIQLQIDLLERRLVSFAEKQAQWRHNGWEIREVEWKPQGGSVEFLVDDTPVKLSGRIDRIDYHPTTQQWAVWDYKTGNKVKQPANAHLRMDGTWCDLQLPLYCVLMKELLEGQLPEHLGYIGLCEEVENIGFMPFVNSKGRTKQFADMDACLASADEAAKEVIRKIRAGDFFNRDSFNPSQEEPILRAIGGLGLVEEAGEEGEEEAAE